jgi:hypothetical protein
LAGALLVAQLDPGKQALRERSGGPQGAPERPEERKKKSKKIITKQQNLRKIRAFKSRYLSFVSHFQF